MICPLALVFIGTTAINNEDCDRELQGPSSVAGWLATVFVRSAASWLSGTARLRAGGACTPLRIHGTKVQRAACLLARADATAHTGRSNAVQWGCGLLIYHSASPD